MTLSEKHAPTAQSIVAAFDFDGTITYRDSLLPFLFFRSGLIQTAWGLGLVAPFIALDVARGTDRQVMKERVLTRFFKGVPLDVLRRDAERFSKEQLPKQVRPEALERLRWHQDQGHRCILVSASVDLYLEPWAHAAGFHDVLSSRLAVDSEGRATGLLTGANCRGAEKVKRLEELLGPKSGYLLYAYGDSKGDKELLDLADHAYMKEWPHA